MREFAAFWQKNIGKIVSSYRKGEICRAFQKETDDKTDRTAYNEKQKSESVPWRGVSWSKRGYIDMEKRKKRLLKCPKLGRRAERLLLITLPVVLILAVYTAVYIADKDTYEIAAKMDTIYFMLDRLGMSLALSILGSLMFDMLDKREKKE